MPPSVHTLKTKITVTLSPEVVHQLDAFSAAPLARSRSQLVEEALREWLERQVQSEIERQTEEYYRSLPPAEQEEDQQWSALTSETAKRFWE
ncbi:MAG: ribbon-helix-helix domain-containing protein [Candidatus Binatia bacterium]